MHHAAGHAGDPNAPACTAGRGAPAAGSPAHTAPADVSSGAAAFNYADADNRGGLNDGDGNG